MKKILFLGAATFQIPPVQYALDKGYYVITCDNVPENPGHQLAHKSFNISTIDYDGILSVARQENIDGIMTFGSDVSAPIAAYVAEKLGLPGNSPDSVRMLTNKAQFRAFLNSTGLQPQKYRSFHQSELNSARHYIESLTLPVVVKPVDSAGSKGVSILSNMHQVDRKLAYAFENSISKYIVVEQYVQKLGRQVCGDGFVLNGNIVFVEFGDGHFYNDGEYLAPYAETFPGTHQPEHLTKVRQKLQTIVCEVGFKRGPFNLDVLIDQSGEPFIIEIGPRSGGNFIPRAIQLNTGVDVIAAAVETCLNWEYQFPDIPARQDKFFACYMVHSREGGILGRVVFSDEIIGNVFETNLYLKAGDQVHPFQKANSAVGNVILRFDSFNEMQTKMDNMQQYCYPEFDA